MSNHKKAKVLHEMLILANQLDLTRKFSCADRIDTLFSKIAKTKGFVDNIEDLSLKNDNFRQVLYTAPHMQLVVMSLPPGEEIGQETHSGLDQFFRIEQGTAEITINDATHQATNGFAALVPADSKHNIKNIGKSPLKLYTLYAPPQHADQTVHQTKTDAKDSKEHFTGKTTESE